MNKIRLYTNVGKAQIDETDSHFKIKGIPITKNNSVMNEIAYFEDDNRKGMPSMVDQPITLRHPEVNGTNVSVKDGKGLNYWSGSLIESAPYVNSGKWFVDVQINKAKLAAHEDGERWTEILTNKETFGVSTGLTFSANNESGELDGKSYSMRAKGQNYDHLAFLDPKVEAPAGGKDTTVYFNSAVNEGEVITCNVDEEDWPLVKQLDSAISNNDQTFINKLLSTLKAAFVNENKSGYNDTDLNTNEDRVMRNLIEAKLKAAGKEVEGLDEAALLDAYNSLEKPVEKEKEVDIASIVADAVNKAVEPLKAEIAANKEDKLKGLRDAVNKLELGLPEIAVNAMGEADLTALVEKHGGSFATGYPTAVNARAVSNASDDAPKFTMPGQEA